MKTCFVTGGSGFVGRYLIAELRRRGYAVRALARSDQAARTVEDLGATSVRGDLDDLTALQTGMAGCDAVFHLAAVVDFNAPAEQLYRVHVVATHNVVAAARQAQVGHLLYLGAASVVANASRQRQLPETFVAPYLHDGYSATKLQAEQYVLAANSSTLKTYAVRPPLIWGVGFSGYAEFKQSAESGEFWFIDGGKHVFSTCHVRNLVEALLLVYEKSPGGHIYFITDGETWTLKRFLTTLLRLYSLPHEFSSLPYSVARVAATVLDAAWRVFNLKGAPPLTKTLLYLFGKEFTISDQKIRRELGFRNVISIEEGMREIERAQAQQPQTA
ncbi:NAD-dependent epimerase/dehydratase family protein [Hymenobacter weizhouensis]|uniref:NAD-dependent epimerase/dehydratase family protein n=1 Tax=Hymenobacter sp. YIM 151500-1 TaxID=2987689 RepID=UPI002226637E|nr:NAD-dependent epimerase/dehydratase family protein [Hymenobacter sp. YIM 151500-1]UYZ63793.1 NAD-dependent epimerase/dehydratase family protein [Hymenobacter sp. YIM 151500-1]